MNKSQKGLRYGNGPLGEHFITKFNLQFKRGFTKVVVTRARSLTRMVARRASTACTINGLMVN